MYLWKFYILYVLKFDSPCHNWELNQIGVFTLLRRCYDGLNAGVFNIHILVEGFFRSYISDTIVFHF